MKTKALLIGAIFFATASSSIAQMDINLNLQHKFNADDFTYGTTYTVPGGPAVSLSRVQYYLSGFELTHDGGQTLPLPDAYVLASGNISNYTLTTENITTLENISFDLGVDSVRNHQGVSFWPGQHPLGSKSPTMDWGWPAGYFFWTIDGMVDGNGDGTPNVPFELHGFGDNLLRDVDAFPAFSVTDNAVDLVIYVNIADWLLSIDLPNVGSDHSGGPNNVDLANNTNEETVFTMDPNVEVPSISTAESHIYADYTVTYAPTIYYNLATLDNVDIQVYDMSGRVVLEDMGQNYEGNYFIRKELESGSYIIVFKNEGLEESLKFVVQK